ncbi:MAG: acylneuraminate cytidylyltransferase family protein [Myxococcota bacterium]|nr:acylneuraminate cytidylyltransferase family protein [Myxococcota bacterium]
MLRSEPLTAVIGARGGSKGIPAKNLYRLAGDTLLERAIKLAAGSPFVDRIAVSTDDPEMHALASAHGAAPPWLRPAALATDEADAIDFVIHLVETLPIEAGYVLLLQPTTPLRTSADLEGLCRSFEESPEARAIVSLVEHEAPHPEKIQKIEDGWVRSYLGTRSGRPRQSLPEVYALNGAFYLAHRDTVVSERSFMPEHTLPYLMPPERSVNLDTPYDLMVLEALVANGSVTPEVL